MKEMHVLYEQMLLQQRREECPPAIHPELSSLIDYLNENNLSTIYGPLQTLNFYGIYCQAKFPLIQLFGIPRVSQSGAKPNPEILCSECCWPF
jgi:hypothetical protein